MISYFYSNMGTKFAASELAGALGCPKGRPEALHWSWVAERRVQIEVKSAVVF